MKFFAFLRNEKGVSELAALMMAVGIGGVVVASNMQMISNTVKNLKGMEKTSEGLELRRDIELLLADENTCTANFKNMAGNSTEHLTALLHTGGSNAFTMNTPYGLGGVKVISWSLQDTPVIIKAGPPAHRLVQLNLKMELTGEVTGSKSLIRTVGLFTRKKDDANSEIETCYSVAGDGSDLWLKAGNTGHIYNTDFQNVGIGTNTVPSPLTIAGSFRTSQSALVNSMRATQDYTGSGDVWAAGRGGVAPGLGAYRMTVGGRSLLNGALNVDGTLNSTSGNMSATTSVGGNLAVAGSSVLASTSVTRNATFANTSQFEGAAVFNGVVSVAGNMGVRTPAAGAPQFLVAGDGYAQNAAMANRLQSTNGYCIAGNCRTNWGTQTCSNGQVVSGVNVDGTVICANPNCPANTFYQGLDNSGQPICRSLPTPSCPANEYITNYNAITGVYTCQPIAPGEFVPSCPPNQYLVGVSNGVPNCAPTALLGQSCPAGQSAQGINIDGSVVCVNSFVANACPSNQVAVGINASGTVICGNPFTAATCPTGQTAQGYDANGLLVCGLPSVAGGSCSGNGVQAINTNAAVSGCM